MKEAREFDVVLWGATGFTGEQVAKQLVERGGDARWAIAGRDRAKLEALAARLDANPAIIIADSFDRASLEAMAERTSVVATTVGPYSKYGTLLVEACIAQGTHCCDLTGEPHWIRTLVDEHHDAAVKGDVRIVNCCGFDSIPSDLGVFVLQEAALAEHGAPCDEVRFVVWRISGGISGGTVASAIEIAKVASSDPQTRRIIFDPYALNPASMRSGADDRRVPGVVHYDDLDTWTATFFMESINAKIVRRSNALMGRRYGDFRYSERVRTGPGLGGRIKARAMSAAIGAALGSLAVGPLRALLEKTVLPAPGEGPSEERIARGGFDIRLIGTWDDGRSDTLTTRVTAKGDPGYGVTATMLAEAALCLALDELPDAAGILTPATAMGAPLLARLRAADINFAVEA